MPTTDPNKVEFRLFVDRELKAAALRKCKEQGTNLTFILSRYLKEWSSDAPPAAISADVKQKPIKRRKP